MMFGVTFLVIFYKIIYIPVSNVAMSAWGAVI